MTTKNKGAELNPDTCSTLLKYYVNLNSRCVVENRLSDRRAIMLWGDAGIGKTSIVRQLHGMSIQVGDDTKKVVVTEVPIAQIEEAGDLLGLPDKDENGTVTKYAAPDWLPLKSRYGDTPVVFMIDDATRADTRILNALMQLIQDKRTLAGELCDHITIVLTSNEAGTAEQHNVNEIDNALRTRLFHAYIKFDVDSWCKWAVKNNVDERVITWVSTHPEVIATQDGSRTNPRTVAALGHDLIGLDGCDDSALLAHITYGNIDEMHAPQFIKYVTQGFAKVVDPETILNNWSKALKEFKELPTRTLSKGQKNNDRARNDVAAIMCYRMLVYLTTPGRKLNKIQKNNFNKYLLHRPVISMELVYMLLRKFSDPTLENVEMLQELVRDNKDLEDQLEEVV